MLRPVPFTIRCILLVLLLVLFMLDFAGIQFLQDSPEAFPVWRLAAMYVLMFFWPTLFVLAYWNLAVVRIFAVPRITYWHALAIVVLAFFIGDLS